MKSNELFLEFNKMWKNYIEKIYKKGNINNERQLQAYIFKYFNDIFREDNQIWIEPLLIINKNKNYPDIVITDTNDKIISIIEIKYVPNYYSVFENDIKKLELYYSNNIELYAEIDPYSGKYKNKTYSKDNDCIYCFMVICNFDSKALDKIKTDIDKDHFYHFIGSIKREIINFKINN